MQGETGRLLSYSPTGDSFAEFIETSLFVLIDTRQASVNRESIDRIPWIKSTAKSIALGVRLGECASKLRTPGLRLPGG